MHNGKSLTQDDRTKVKKKYFWLDALNFVDVTARVQGIQKVRLLLFPKIGP